MAAKLTNEQRDEIIANPHQAVPVVDDQSGKTYFVVEREFLFDSVESDSASRERLLQLLDEGEQSGEVSKDDAHTRMQATINRYRSPNA
jgi:hypothetical protein